MCIVRIKETVDRTCDTVDLTESSDTEKSDTDAEKCKKLRKPFLVFSHSLFNIIERTAKAVTVRSNDTVFDS